MLQINCGVIGLGIGEAHAANCVKHPNAELLKICDFDNEKAIKLAKKFNCEAAGCAEDILDDPEIDLVVIASYDSYHFEQAKRAIENGKHVYIEKPAVCTSEQAKQLRALLKSGSSSISSNLVLRTCPLFCDLKEQLQSGTFKNVYFIQASYLWGRVHKILDGWRTKDPDYSIISGAAVHLVDLVCWLTGELPYQVSACGNKISTANANSFDDFNSLRLYFADDMIAEISAHGGCAHPHFHELRIYGTKKTFFHDLSGSRWVDINGLEFIDDAKYPAKEKRYLAFYSFIDHLGNKEIPAMISQDDMFNSLSICLAAQESLKQNNEVTAISYY